MAFCCILLHPLSSKKPRTDGTGYRYFFPGWALDPGTNSGRGVAAVDGAGDAGDGKSGVLSV